MKNGKKKKKVSHCWFPKEANTERKKFFCTEYPFAPSNPKEKSVNKSSKSPIPNINLSSLLDPPLYLFFFN